VSAARFVIGDVFDGLASLPDASVDCVMTSPPFLALRSYLPPDHPDKGKEIGAEPTPAAFLDTMLALTAELRRVVAPHGSIFVELGDTYSGSGGGGGDYLEGGIREGQQQFGGSAASMRESNAAHWRAKNRAKDAWPLPKSLCFVPELYGASLAYGRNLLTGEESPAGQWLVRNKVAWVRPNPPVGALGDKVRPGWSMGVWACTSPKRWFDLDAVRTTNPRVDERPGRAGPTGYDDPAPQNPAGAPPLDWWKIPPGGYQGSHYAVFPPELCRIPIEASCPRRVCRTCGEPSRRETEATHDKERNARVRAAGGPVDSRRDGGASGFATTTTTTTGWSSCGCPGTDGIRLDGYHTGTGWRPGVVLDPFAGSGTTLMVATGRSRDAIGLDLDERNAELATDRVGPMFLTVEHLSDEGAA
jgi:site-specific DNA-methyltransferase (adenine-specific)